MCAVPSLFGAKASHNHPDTTRRVDLEYMRVERDLRSQSLSLFLQFASSFFALSVQLGLGVQCLPEEPSCFLLLPFSHFGKLLMFFSRSSLGKPRTQGHSFQHPTRRHKIPPPGSPGKPPVTCHVPMRYSRNPRREIWQTTPTAVRG